MIQDMKISGGACILLALMLLILPLQWLVAGMFAAAVHELGHYLAICACSQGKRGIRIFSYGAKLPLPPMSRGKELLCALAGPLAGFSLLFLARWLPRTALCALVQSLYNLLPIYPLDGGRALRCLLSMLLSPPNAKKAEKWTANFCRILVLGLSLFAAVCLKLGIFPLLLAILLLIRTK